MDWYAKKNFSKKEDEDFGAVVENLAEPIKTYGLELRAAEACNLTCVGCSQSSPFLEPEYPDLHELEECLSLLSKVLSPGRLTVLGGEPLLNKDICSVLNIVRNCAMQAEIYLTTNGLLLDQTDDAFWELVDCIELSVYPATRSILEKKLPSIRNMARAFNVRLDLLETDTFRHINLTHPIENAPLIEKIYKACNFKMHCHTLYNGRFYLCAPAPNVARAIEGRTGERIQFHSDGIEIVGNSRLNEQLVAYLSSESPLDACSYCLGSSGVEFQHGMMKNNELKHHALSFSDSLLDSDRMSFSYRNGLDR